MTENGPIYLIKEDNVLSEQTFIVEIQTSDSVPSGSGFNPATINVDYELGVTGTATALLFPPNIQRILFSFTLLSDNLPEGTEAFLASSAPEDNAEVGGVEFDVPGFLSPISLSQETFIVIGDDDCKFLLLFIKHA